MEVRAGLAGGAAAGRPPTRGAGQPPWLAALRAAPWTPPGPETAGADRQVVRELVRLGLVVERDGAYFAAEAVDEAARTVAGLLATSPGGRQRVASIRDALATTRKFVLPLLAQLTPPGSPGAAATSASADPGCLPPDYLSAATSPSASGAPQHRESTQMSAAAASRRLNDDRAQSKRLTTMRSPSTSPEASRSHPPPPSADLAGQHLLALHLVETAPDTVGLADPQGVVQAGRRDRAAAANGLRPCLTGFLLILALEMRRREKH